MIVSAGLACAALGAAAGLDIDLIRPAGGWISTLAGTVIGLLFGLLLGVWQARYEKVSGARTQASAWLLALGGAMLVLSVASFAVSQLVPGVRPLLLARRPLALDRPNTATFTFKADAAAPLAVVLALQEDPKIKALKGMPIGNRPKETASPPSSTIEVSTEPEAAFRIGPAKALEASGAKHIGLGTLDVVEGKHYTVTASIAAGVPVEPYWDPHIEVHRTMDGWARAFPRMFVAGVLGLLFGITGAMLMAWGGVQRWTAKQAGK